jgi:hypothetical protein
LTTRNKNLETLPGPGNYSPSDSPGRRLAPKFSFPSEKRLKPLKNASIPGPGIKFES